MPYRSMSRSTKGPFSFPWIRDAALWAEYEEHCESSILRGALFACLVGVCLPLRCSWQYIPKFNALWFAALGSMGMGSLGVVLHCTILYLKLLRRNGSTEHAGLLDRILRLKGGSVVNLPDVIAVAGTLSWCFMLLGRVANPCPSDVDYWSSQYCNPYPDSIPTDDVVAVFLVQLCVMVFLRGTTIQVIMACYATAIIFVSIALALVGDTLEAFTVVLVLFAMVTVLEVECIFREEFLNRRARNELLKQIFPARIVPQLLNGDNVKPTEHDNVCVFFSDIVNFTELTHSLGPLGILSLVNEINSITDNCVLQFEPKVSKVDTVGDGYFCECGVVWGGGSLGENCTTILKFALMVQAQMSAIINPLTGRPLELRIGVHSGSCAAGLVGNQTLLPHFSLFGDLINATARIETTSSPGMIHVSDETVQAVTQWQAEADRHQHDQPLTFAYRGVVDLKGLGPMRTWWLLRGPATGFNAPIALLRHAPNNMLDYAFDVRNVAPDAASLEPAIFALFSFLFELDVILVNPTTLKNFIHRIGSMYSSSVQYHNFHHAFAVLQFTAALYHHNVMQSLVPGGVKQSLAQTMFVSMIAVLCHDVGHDGLNNSHHVNSKSHLARTYFNQSPLENSHISLTNAALGMHGCNVFENWGPDFHGFARNLISNSILATDMKMHDDVLADLAVYEPAILSQPSCNFNESGGERGVVAALQFNEDQYELLRLSRFFLHAADISNSVRPFAVSRHYAEKLAGEFGEQVARERRLGLPVAAFMVISDEAALARGELFFLKVIAKPYFIALAAAFPHAHVLIAAIDLNIEKWSALLDDPAAL